MYDMLYSMVYNFINNIRNFLNIGKFFSIRNIILLFVVTILILIGIYKIKFKFWARQPVFHYHNIWYWLFPPGIIQHDKPVKDIFYDKNIYFDSFYKVSTEKKALFVSLIQNNYMPHKNEKYQPTKKGILNYFKSHNSKSYLSLLFDKININKLIGAMTTRPLTCYINDKELPLYYVDFLCVHEKYRKKGIAPKIIYSHYVNSRYNNKNTVFLFKREGETTLIVPLTVYNNYLYDIQYWDKNVMFDKPNIKTILITPQTFYILRDVLERIYKSQFNIIILPNIGNLKRLIKDQQVFVAVTKINSDIYDLFFFRNTYTSYNNSKSLECFASFKETDISVFVLSFLCAVSQISNRLECTKLLIENISHNNYIIKRLGKRYSPIDKFKTSYYFYNFGYRPFLSNSSFIIN